MTEMERIRDQFRRAYEGDAWYGPGLLEILKDITPEMAFEKPNSMDRTIAGSLLHLMTWMNFVLRITAGEEFKVSREEDWPILPETSSDNWETILNKYHDYHRRIMDYFTRFTENKLNDIVPGKQFSYYFLFHGIIQHTVYHTGQIALLKCILMKK